MNDATPPSLVGFKWRCRDGRQIRPADMKTTHLFYTLRAIFNASVPAPYRVADCRLYRFAASREYLRTAVDAFIHELSRRPARDLLPVHWDQLRHMATVCRELLTAQLN